MQKLKKTPERAFSFWLKCTLELYLRLRTDTERAFKNVLGFGKL